MKRGAQVEESKNLVADSFMKLLKQKSFDEITLAEIADNSSVSRMTIHRHFKTKENIALYRVKNIISRFNDKKFKNGKHTLEDDLLNRFTIIRNLPNAKLLVHSQHISSIIYDQNKESNILLAKNYSINTEDMYLIHFIEGGVNNILKEWIKNDFDKTPKEMTDIVMKVLSVLNE